MLRNEMNLLRLMKWIGVRSTPCALNPRIFINFADRIGLS